MGRSLATTALVSQPVQFEHAKTGRRYRVFRSENDVLIEESFLDQSGRLIYSDTRKVSYAIGSGNHARSFLVERSGRLYEAPVTFYTQKGRWDMSPGYDSEQYVGFTRKVTENCLFCHAGRLHAAEIAIGCERCHGPGKAHLSQPGKAIVNPAKLEPQLRDQVCEQCHLFGAARVVQPGKSLADYRAGEPLGHYLAIYSYDLGSNEPSVTGHPEEMKRSVCWQRSQGKLWCGSCHMVHSAVSAGARCGACHRQNACSRKPDRSSDCVSCHMPKRPVIESAHVTFTDHRILRRPQAVPPQPPVTGRLKLVLHSMLNDRAVAARDLGFAYAQLASSTGRDELNRLAADILGPLAETPLADVAFFENLGEAYLAIGEIRQAETAFHKALERDPKSASAHYSLGYLTQFQGKLQEAIRAYEKAVEIDPEKSEAWGNLAAAYLTIGEREKSAKSLDVALKLEPGNLAWRRVLEGLRANVP